MLSRVLIPQCYVTGDWAKDSTTIRRWIADHFAFLNAKGTLWIESAEINGTPIGQSTPGAGAFTTLSASSLLDISAAAAGQIKFPATQNASANANTLDDYEEGSWTPIDSSGAGLTLTVASAKYVKVGRSVTAHCKVTYPATASAALSKIGGLPFTAADQVPTSFGAVAGTATWGLLSATAINPEPPAGSGIANSVYSGATIWMGFSYQV